MIIMMFRNCEIFPALRWKKKIEQAVIHLFSDSYYHQLNMRDISREADVSIATIYKYYGYKENLVFIFARKWMAAIRDRILDHLQSLENTKEKLRKIVWVYLDYFERNPDIGRIILLSIPMKMWMSDKNFAMKDWIDLFIDVVRKGQRDGILKTDARSADLIDFIQGAVTRAFIMWIFRGQKERLVDKTSVIFNIIWGGIAEPEK